MKESAKGRFFENWLGTSVITTLSESCSSGKKVLGKVREDLPPKYYKKVNLSLTFPVLEFDKESCKFKCKE